MMQKSPTSKAVINTDREALNKYKMERLYQRKVDQLHSDVVEIKQCLLNISERIEKLESDTNNG